MVSKLNCEPFHSVNSPACVPVRQRRPSGVHTATLMLQRICAIKQKSVECLPSSRRVLCYMSAHCLAQHLLALVREAVLCWRIASRRVADLVDADMHKLGRVARGRLPDVPARRQDLRTAAAVSREAQLLMEGQ